MKKRRRIEKQRPPDDESSFLDIDLHRLDKECVEHPVMVKEYAIEVADAKLDVEETKSELEMLTAEMDLAIREDPEAYGLEKITESAISHVISLQELIQNKKKELRQASHAMAIAQAAVAGADARGQRIADLVKLHGQQYFSVPRVTSEGVKEVEKRSARGRLRKGYDK